MYCLCPLLLVACIFDFKRRKIPNPIILVVFLTGIARYIFHQDYEGILFGLFMGLVFLVASFPLYRVGTFGAGDLKLICACSMYFRDSHYFLFIVLSLLCAGIIALFKMAYLKNFRERFSYLFEYLVSFMTIKRTEAYFSEGFIPKDVGICMAFPIFLGSLPGLWGLYG